VHRSVYQNLPGVNRSVDQALASPWKRTPTLLERIHTLSYKPTHMHTHMCTHVYMNTHVQSQTRTHTRTDTRTHTHTHTHRLEAEEVEGRHFGEASCRDFRGVCVWLQAQVMCHVCPCTVCM